MPRKELARRAPAVNNTLRLLTLSGLLIGASWLTGCGAPPELAGPTGRPSASVPPPVLTPSPPVPSHSAAVPTTPTPSSSGSPAFGELFAVPCAGNPSDTQLLALLRRSVGLLPGNTQATVTFGPLCAGTWQYSIVQVPGREPLQVVSTGPATGLELVTAGTDVCNIPVRTAAPPGIRTIACEAGPLPTTDA